jgi:hypothetical protein
LPHPNILRPTVTLFLLSPTVAELLSGSSPPLEFFNPIVFLLLASLYGSGAIIVRELTMRWGKGWPSILLLGAAYGILEEGLMVKSFFDPGWIDLGILGTYGRWLGVNWVWAEWLTIYHSIFSITIPILIVNLIYPSYRKTKWVGNRILVGFFVLLLSVVLFGHIFLTPYPLSLEQIVGSIIIMAMLVYMARKFPVLKAGENRINASAWLFWLIGFFIALIFFITFGALPYIISFPVFTMIIGVIIIMGFALLIVRLSRRRIGDLQSYGLASGALSFLIFLTSIQEMDKNRMDNPAGMTLVGLTFLLFLIFIGIRVRSSGREPRLILEESNIVQDSLGKGSTSSKKERHKVNSFYGSKRTFYGRDFVKTIDLVFSILGG